MTAAGGTKLQMYIQALKRSGLSWDEIGSTLRSYSEKGVPGNPQDGTLVRLDGLMGWRPGSARAVFDGGEPVPIDPPDPTVVNDRVVALIRRIGALANEAADLLEEGQ